MARCAVLASNAVRSSRRGRRGRRRGSSGPGGLHDGARGARRDADAAPPHRGGPAARERAAARESCAPERPAILEPGAARFQATHHRTPQGCIRLLPRQAGQRGELSEAAGYSATAAPDRLASPPPGSDTQRNRSVPPAVGLGGERLSPGRPLHARGGLLVRGSPRPRAAQDVPGRRAPQDAAGWWLHPAHGRGRLLAAPVQHVSPLPADRLPRACQGGVPQEGENAAAPALASLLLH